MQFKDLLLILSVITLWGINFSVMKIGLNYTSPYMFGVLRFAPFIFLLFFFKRPQMPWKIFILYGLTLYFGQFVLLLSGMALGMPAGMASMVLQSQAFFTVFFAKFFLGEAFRVRSFIGLIISALGLSVISLQENTSLTLIGLLLTLGAGSFWAIGNIIMKRYSNANMADLTVWTGIVPILPFFICAMIIDGPAILVSTFENADIIFVLAVLYTSLLATIYGNTIWGKLIRKYSVSYVAPFSLLVPVVGISASAFFLKEHLTIADGLGAAIVIIGLTINVFGGKLFNIIKTLLPLKI